MVKKCLSRMSGKLSRTVLRRGKGSNPFFLVDYTSWGFKKRLESRNLTQSMSRVGKCIDNGPMEGFWGTLKCEKYYLHKYQTFDSLKKDIDDYIYFYNYERLQAKLNSLSPMEFRTKAA
jgi:transposase InsO family protein